MTSHTNAVMGALLSLSLCVAACDGGGEKADTAAKTDDKKDSEKKDDKKEEAKKADEAKPADAKPEAKPAEAKPEAKAILPVQAAKIDVKGDEPGAGLEIKADGTVTVGGELVGKVSTDGKLTQPDGSVYMTVSADGKIMEGSEEVPMKLEANGARLELDGEGLIVKFEAGGKVNVTGEKGEPAPAEFQMFVHEGCEGEMGKTCGIAFINILVAELLEAAE